MLGSDEGGVCVCVSGVVGCKTLCVEENWTTTQYPDAFFPQQRRGSKLMWEREWIKLNKGH